MFHKSKECRAKHQIFDTLRHKETTVWLFTEEWYYFQHLETTLYILTCFETLNKCSHLYLGTALV